jgi:hypothetical protein
VILFVRQALLFRRERREDPIEEIRRHTGLPCPVQKVIALLLLVSERPDDQGGRAPNRARQHEQ